MLLRRRARRKGATIVEAAFVLSIFLMLLFGLFEYCRFIMVQHVTNNAARDGARYAVVNLDKPSNFDTVDYSASRPSIKNFTKARMGGVWKQIDNVIAGDSPNGFEIAVYACDPTGLGQTPPDIKPKRANSGLPFPDPFVSGAANSVPWNSAAFTERIAVTIRGSYRPFTPVLLLMPPSIRVYTTALMGSEG